MSKMQVTRTISERTVWTLTDDDVKEAVRLYCEAPKEAHIAFQIGEGLRGAVVTHTADTKD